MKRVAVTLVAMTAIASALSAHAVTEQDFNAETATQLATLCGADVEQSNSIEALSFCYGFIEGAAGVYLELVGAGEMKKITCPPATVTTGELAMQVVSWVAADTDRASVSATNAVFEAAAAKWPCP